MTTGTEKSSKKILRLSRSYREFSAGTLFTTQNLPSPHNTTGMVKCKSLSPMARSRRTGETHTPELDIPVEYLDEAKSRTFIVPTINGKERRRRVRKAMRDLHNR